MHRIIILPSNTMGRHLNYISFYTAGNELLKPLVELVIWDGQNTKLRSAGTSLHNKDVSVSFYGRCETPRCPIRSVILPRAPPAVPKSKLHLFSCHIWSTHFQLLRQISSGKLTFSSRLKIDTYVKMVITVNNINILFPY